jgi:hypothetical protein
VGAAGGEQNHNGLCILSQNIINEKMYLGSNPAKNFEKT